jgi:hypothetical protein
LPGAHSYRPRAVDAPAAQSPRCPTCRALVRWEGNAHRPFCSQRCRLIDLGQWASEGYRVAGDPIVPDDDSDDGSD